MQQQRRLPPGQVPGRVGRRPGAGRQEEAPPEPDHLHHLPAARAGAGLREEPLPRRLLPRGAGHEGQPARGPRAGQFKANAE